jgi:hypothetical protein
MWEEEDDIFAKQSQKLLWFQSTCQKAVGKSSGGGQS